MHKFFAGSPDSGFGFIVLLRHNARHTGQDAITWDSRATIGSLNEYILPRIICIHYSISSAPAPVIDAVMDCRNNNTGTDRSFN
jgi:hypothetical protein